MDSRLGNVQHYPIKFILSHYFAYILNRNALLNRQIPPDISVSDYLNRRLPCRYRTRFRPVAQCGWSVTLAYHFKDTLRSMRCTHVAWPGPFLSSVPQIAIGVRLRRNCPEVGLHRAS
ncbi:hypothetical protein T10_4631 [Trichinella papuae]|uniref:Uncharacterized protein n=1 Tax=Trichinella papuae TaxID=268474 RepID=A0A0V1MEZ6_9BILA|nr:hypothetical protein T10_1631 [Trichinella papuae]KRZ70188.1 hypothetical protein T10_4631 [Trichinella papuae]